MKKPKQNIGVTSLDESTRKKLFNEFVEAGGEVINEKEEQRLTDFDKNLQKRYKIKLEAEKNQNKFQYADADTQKTQASKYQPESKQKNKSVQSV